MNVGEIPYDVTGTVNLKSNISKPREYFSAKLGKYLFLHFLNRMTSLLCQFINFFKGGRVPLSSTYRGTGPYVADFGTDQPGDQCLCSIPCSVRYVSHRMCDIVANVSTTRHKVARATYVACAIPGIMLLCRTVHHAQC